MERCPFLLEGWCCLALTSDPEKRSLGPFLAFLAFLFPNIVQSILYRQSAIMSFPLPLHCQYAYMH